MRALSGPDVPGMRQYLGRRALLFRMPWKNSAKNPTWICVGVYRAMDSGYGGVLLPVDCSGGVLASGAGQGAQMILGRPTPLAVVDDAIAGVRSAGTWVLFFWLTNLPLRLVHGIILAILIHWGVQAASCGSMFRFLLLISIPLGFLAVWGRVIYLRSVQAALLDAPFGWRQVCEIRKTDFAGAWFLTMILATCAALLAFTVFVPFLGVLCVPLGVAAAHNLPHLGPQESLRRLGRVINPVGPWLWGGLIVLFVMLLVAINVFLLVGMSFSLVADLLPELVQRLSKTFSFHNSAWVIATLWVGYVITEPLLYGLAARQALQEESRRRGVDLAAWLRRQEAGQ
jgi:hypothetical protein